MISSTVDIAICMICSTGSASYINTRHSPDIAAVFFEFTFNFYSYRVLFSSIRVFYGHHSVQHLLTV
jgi:hypothetical protein